MTKVFISHNSLDKPLARRIDHLLNLNGFKSWLDEGEIKFGESLIRKITDGIHNSDYLIALITPNSVTSKWVNYELEKAMSLEITLGKPIVVPIVVSECQVPRFLLEKRYLKLANSDELKANEVELLQSLNASVEIQIKPIFSNIRFMRDDKNDSSELQTNPTFTTPIRKIRAVWNAKYPYQGMNSTRKWYRNDEKWREKNDVFDGLWRNPDSMSTFILNKRGHPMGKYAMRLFIEGEYQCTGYFNVVDE